MMNIQLKEKLNYFKLETTGTIISENTHTHPNLNNFNRSATVTASHIDRKQKKNQIR